MRVQVPHHASERRAAPPGPHVRGYIGSVLKLLEYSRDPLATLTSYSRAYGDVVRMRLAGYVVDLVNRPEYIRSVFQSTNSLYIKEQRTPQSRTVRRVFGDGLLTGEGASWSRQRRLAQPAFQSAQLVRYAPTIVDYAVRVAQGWPIGPPMDIYQEMRAITRAISAKIFFDIDVSEEGRRLGEILERMAAHVIGQTRIFLVPERIPTPANLAFTRDLRDLDEIVYEMIRRRRSQPMGRGDMLEALIRARDDDGTGMSDRQLRDEVITIYTAGHETIALATTWSWHLLAFHPDVQVRVQEEVDEVTRGKLPTAADLPRFRRARQVLLESMRLYPPIWRVGRQALADCELGPYVVPAGGLVLISQWLAHRNPEYFADPEQFRPERWDDDGASLPPFAYFPFGWGPRICIARELAFMEGTLLLATLAQRFHFRPAGPEHLPLSAGITLRPKGPVRVHVERRTLSAER